MNFLIGEVDNQIGLNLRLIPTLIKKKMTLSIAYEVSKGPEAGEKRNDMNNQGRIAWLCKCPRVSFMLTTRLTRIW